jgi:hypothetical protein
VGLVTRHKPKKIPPKKKSLLFLPKENFAKDRAKNKKLNVLLPISRAAELHSKDVNIKK